MKFKIIEIRTGCQHGRYLYDNENLMGHTKPSTGPHAASGLGVADLVVA